MTRRASILNLRSWAAMLLLAVTLALVVRGQSQPTTTPSAPTDRAIVHFQAMDIFLDAGTRELGSYQVELKAAPGTHFVGLEGGDGVFNPAPYYDPAALAASPANENRLIVAAFSTAPNLPHGRVRVARVHLAITENPSSELHTHLVVATDGHGTVLSGATVNIIDFSGDKK